MATTLWDLSAKTEGELLLQENPAVLVAMREAVVKILNSISYKLER